MAVAGLGLLLWARLILISDMPRMALAEPEDDAASMAVADPAPTPNAGPAVDTDAPADGASAPR